MATTGGWVVGAGEHPRPGRSTSGVPGAGAAGVTFYGYSSHRIGQRFGVVSAPYAAVYAALLMSVVLFMKRMTDVTKIREITRELSGPPSEENLRAAAEAMTRLDVPEDVVVYDAEGAFFFGVAESLRDTLTIGAFPPKVMILRMRHVIALDASG